MLPGAYDSPESREAFARLSLELAVSPAAPVTLATGVSVSGVMLAYLKFAVGYYGQTKELGSLKDALRVVQGLYGPTSAADFGPRALAAVRESFVRRGWSRQYTNRQTNRIVRAFRWSSGEELIPIVLHTALKALAPLRKGKTTAPEAPPRLPADPVAVDAALPHLPPHTRSLVELLRLTGMRPAEACRMTLGEIDGSGDVWIYAPAKHKMAHKGKRRPVALGAAAQAVIVAHLENKAVGSDQPLFSPRRQRDERFARMRAKRKTRVQPRQVSRKKGKPKRMPGEWFTAAAVCRAVAKACKKAGVASWSPYQLRHLKGAELREKFSLEHVRAALGHSHASMSAHYAAGADAVLAAEVARKAG